MSARYELGFFKPTMTLILPDGVRKWNCSVPGGHNVCNALAAAAVASPWVSIQAEIASGLSEFGGVKGRMQKKHGLEWRDLDRR